MARRCRTCHEGCGSLLSAIDQMGEVNSGLKGLFAHGAQAACRPERTQQVEIVLRHAIYHDHHRQAWLRSREGRGEYDTNNGYQRSQ